MVALSSLLVLAIFLRLLSYGNAMWVDEAWRALMIGDFTNPKWWSSTYFAITAFGYAVVCWIIGFIYNTEYMIRLTSLLPNIIAIGVMYQVVKTLSRSTLIALCAAFILTITPLSVDFSREFKPYSMELLTHLLVLWFLVRTFLEPTRRNIRWLMASVPIGILFAINIVFALPSVALLLFHLSRKDVTLRRPALVYGALIVLQLGIFYAVAWRLAGDDAGLLVHWKDNFFQGPFSIASYSQFLSHHTQQMLHGFVFSLFQNLNPSTIPWLPWVFLLLGFVKSLKEKTLILFFTLLLPILTVIALNFISKWPYGYVRVNLFMMAYILPISVLPFSWRYQFRFRQAVLVLVTAAFFVLQSPVRYISEFEWSPKNSSQEVPKAMDFLMRNYEMLASPKQVYVFSSTSVALDYYINLHVNTKGPFSKFFSSTAEYKPIAGFVTASATEKVFSSAPKGPAIYLYSMLSDDDVILLKQVMAKHFTIGRTYHFEGAGLIELRRD